MHCTTMHVIYARKVDSLGFHSSQHLPCSSVSVFFFVQQQKFLLDQVNPAGSLGLVPGQMAGSMWAGAKIVSSINGPGGVVHEVDGLISPIVIWRYMDQLRLPGL